MNNIGVLDDEISSPSCEPIRGRRTDRLRPASEWLRTDRLRPGPELEYARSSALRIHWQRTYRISVGSDAPSLEMRLPQVMSPAAAHVFPSLPWLSCEPVLAEDNHGPPALAELGFPLGQRKAMKRLIDAFEAREQEHDSISPPTEMDLMAAHQFLVARVRQLETDEAAVMAAIEDRPSTGWQSTGA